MNLVMVVSVSNWSALKPIKIIKYFNELETHDEHNLYFRGLISHHPAKRHRSRLNHVEDAQYHTFSYNFKVRVIRENSAGETSVGILQSNTCITWFSAKRLQTIQHQLVTVGHIETDKRGRHSNQPHKLEENTASAICEHIKSFKGRKSHYSRQDSARTYLHDDHWEPPRLQSVVWNL